MNKREVYICVDAGGTTSKAAIFSKDGTILARGFAESGSPAVTYDRWYVNIEKSVYDHCVAIDLIVRKGRVGEVYNVGGHNERTNLQVVKTVLHALNKPESLITYVTDRKGHDMRYAIDPTKLETELGWKPKYTFDTGIPMTIQWYLDNKEWWENIISGEYQNYFEKMYVEKGRAKE